MSTQQHQLDNLLATIAGETRGIDGLLEAFFGFLGRRTDFYHHDTDEARRVVFAAFERHLAPALERQRQEQEKRAVGEQRHKDNAMVNHPQVEDVTEQLLEKEKMQQKQQQTRSQVKKKTRAPDGGNSNDEGDDDDGSGEGGGAPEGNGGVTDKYRWTQTLTQTEVFIPIKRGTRGKDCKVIIQPKGLTVKVHNEVVVDGQLHSAVLPDDSLWTVEDEGSVLHITLEKVPSPSPEWWAFVLQGDTAIDTQKIVPEPSKLSDLDPELRSTVEKMMFDQEMKQRGLPTSDQQKHARLLEQFQKQHPEFDLSSAKITYPPA